MSITQRRNAPAEPPEPLLDLPLDGVDEIEPPSARRRAGDRDAGSPWSAQRRPRPRRGLGWLWLVLLLAFPLGGLVSYLSRSDPPAAAVSADLLDFGEVRLGMSGVEQTLRISNHGEQDLWIESPALDGDAAGDFQVDAGACLGTGVAAGDACPLRLTFMPADRGARRARLRIETNAPEGPLALPLVGVGVAPELIVGPPRLDLGTRAVGQAGDAGVVRIGNRGRAPLQLGRIELRGPAAADLRLTDGCGSRLLLPGERCSLRVVFAPRAAGSRRAELRIESDDGAPRIVKLEGEAILRAPILRLEPPELDFGSMTVTWSFDRTVTLANDGDAPLAVAALGIEVGAAPGGDAGTAAAFEVTAESCTAAEVTAGDTCDVDLRFLPVAEGAAWAQLAITSNASPEPYRLPLTGTGTVPRAVITPERLSFGRVTIEAWSAPRTVRVASAGSESLEIEAVTLTGADAVSFDVRGCASASLAPADGCLIEVVFQPRRAGPHRAGLRIVSNQDDLTLPLNGIGVAGGR